jgi:hypothetical protein
LGIDDLAGYIHSSKMNVLIDQGHINVLRAAMKQMLIFAFEFEGR